MATATTTAMTMMMMTATAQATITISIVSVQQFPIDLYKYFISRNVQHPQHPV